jgi:hypothetical protein
MHSSSPNSAHQSSISLSKSKVGSHN